MWRSASARAPQGLSPCRDAENRAARGLIAQGIAPETPTATGEDLPQQTALSLPPKSTLSRGGCWWLREYFHPMPGGHEEPTLPYVPGGEVIHSEKGVCLVSVRLVACCVTVRVQAIGHLEDPL